MANYLASIFGTEQDKVNCSFYYKIGACRHGDRCSRKHVKPSYSQTILLPNLYQNPAYDPKNKMTPPQMQMHFDAFYEDIWCELCQYGLVEELVVCDNNNDRTFPSQSITSPQTPTNAYSQTSSATSTCASSTKKTARKPATPSTRAGTPAAPSTANSRLSPTSAKPAVASTAARAASAAASATLYIARNRRPSWTASWICARASGSRREVAMSVA